jgi:hypothetical protein
MERFLNAVIGVLVVTIGLLSIVCIKNSGRPGTSQENPCASISNQAYIRLYWVRNEREQLVRKINSDMNPEYCAYGTDCWDTKQWGPQVLECERWLSGFDKGHVPSFE